MSPISMRVFAKCTGCSSPECAFCDSGVFDPEVAVDQQRVSADSNHVLPTIGGVISGHRRRTSIFRNPLRIFLLPKHSLSGSRAAGFDSVSWRPLTLGIAAIHAGEKR